MYVVKPVAEIWGLLAIHLADDVILPFDYQSYASQLEVCTRHNCNIVQYISVWTGEQ